MSIRENLAKHVERITWPSGLRLLTEHVPGAQTVSIGIWMARGSRHESTALQGVTHMLEHMLFKGTSTQSAQELALAMNALGGHFNAFTTQEVVCVHARVIGEHLERAMRLLAEMVHDSAFAEEEIERERGVILEEIKLTNDTPDDLIHDLFYENLWGEHGLGRSILGTPETVTSIGRSELIEHLSRQIALPQMIVAMAGACDSERAAELVESMILTDGAESGVMEDQPPETLHRRRHFERRLEQIHFCLGTLGPTRTSEDRYAFNLAHSILGGGASSRIFQEIRERRGLAYSIGTFVEPYHDIGCFGVSGGTSPEHLPEVIELTLAEIRRMCREPVGAEELTNAKEQMRAHLLLGLESMGHRMSRVAELEIHFGRHIPLEETLARIDAVTSEDLLDVANTHLAEAPLTIVTLGPGLTPTQMVPETI
ncbi:insulinase family protein [Candidatus Sumerlaeota bacterium]|nr:insulinase family protein [Candidatus Sumerlaeota bacterium]